MTAMRDMIVWTDARGVDYAYCSERDLPKGWALCSEDHEGIGPRAWKDSKVTSVTPAPAGRCPFEHHHVNAEAISYGELIDRQGLTVGDFVAFGDRDRNLWISGIRQSEGDDADNRDADILTLSDGSECFRDEVRAV